MWNCEASALFDFPRLSKNYWNLSSMDGRLGTRPGQTHTGIGVSFGALKYDVRHAALVET